MSPWVGKGLQPPLTVEKKRKLQAGRVRYNHRKRLNEVQQADGGMGKCSPAAWLAATTYVEDYRYVEAECDEVMLRALENRVVYADMAGCHHEPPFQELTVNVIAAVERDARKNGRARKKGLPKLMPSKTVVRKIERKPVLTKKKALVREGPLLTTVVTEMFPESREGRPLLEVVSSLFES